MKTRETIPATLTVSEAIWRFPLSVAVFHAHGSYGASTRSTLP